MLEPPKPQRPSSAWRFPLTLGLTVGVGLPVAWGVEIALEPNLNPWGACAVSILAAGLVGTLVGTAISWLTNRPDSDRS